MNERKTIIFIGPNGNLGISIVQKLLKEYFVIGISRRATKLEISQTYQKYYYPIDIDLRQFNEENLFEKIENLLTKKNSKLHGIVNNAYFGYPEKPFNINKTDVINSSEGIFAIQIRIILLFKKLLYKNSSVVNISSMYGKVAPNPDNYSNKDEINALLYGAMKAALIQSTKWLSALLAEEGIRVNSVSYGPFPSSEVQKRDPSFILKLSRQTHLKRIGKPEESSGIILFLLSSESSYITGADIAVDGGWTAW